jgi:hypothetical protein
MRLRPDSEKQVAVARSAVYGSMATEHGCVLQELTGRQRTIPFAVGSRLTMFGGNGLMLVREIGTSPGGQCQRRRLSSPVLVGLWSTKTSVDTATSYFTKARDN